MKVYVPIGYYNDAEDIIDLFPNSTFKGDEADIVINYFADNYGAFHYIDHPDVDSYYAPDEVSKDKRMVFSSDGQYAVMFSQGDGKLLYQGDDNHGFFIDIYRLEEVEDYERYPNFVEEPDAVEVQKLQTTYDKLLAVREKIDTILMDIAPYIGK